MSSTVSTARTTAGDIFNSSSQPVMHGVVIRPPVYRMVNGHFFCSPLLAVDTASVDHPENTVQVVQKGHFLAVAASNRDVAQEAARTLQVSWGEAPAVPEPSPCQTELAQADSFSRRYQWPSRIARHQQQGWITACAQTGRVEVESATPHLLLAELVALTGLTNLSLTDNRTDALIRDCRDDAAADALVISQALGVPVTVWLDSDSQDRKALGLAQKHDLSCGTDNTLISKQYSASSCAPVLAQLLIYGHAPVTIKQPSFSFPYNFERQSISAPEAGYQPDELFNAQSTFARESWMDELADGQQQDPIQLRRGKIDDDRGRDIIDSVASKAGWTAGDQHFGLTTSPFQDISRGRGFAYSYRPDPGSQDDSSLSESGTRSAWVVDISVNQLSGEVTLDRLVVGQDAGEAVDQQALKQQLQRELLSANSSPLLNNNSFDQWSTQPDVEQEPSSELTTAWSQPELPVQHSSETKDSSQSLPVRYAPGVLDPAVAAVSNAIYNATGLRFREPPFSPELIRLGLNGGDINDGGKEGARAQKSGWKKLATAAAVSVAGTLALAWPWKGAINPIPRPPANLYSPETIERGRLVAEAGDCAVCHTQLEGGITNAGGRGFETPFGTVYSTNLTPDEQTGIGSWSYTAFERAMRQGISRDGRQLYPAFPYTAFAKISDGDMQALYAYLMAQPAVKAEAPAAQMSFPFNQRPLMAGWNAMFHDPQPFQPDPLKSALWNRGAYLAEGLGHCGACHTPRNIFGAEKTGTSYLSGAMVDGWEAPALNQLSKAPVPWTEESLFQYLRSGSAEHHGAAAGPMAPVVAGLAELPEQDVRAIAHYVASFMNPTTETEAQLSRQAASLTQQTDIRIQELEQSQRVFDSSCSACHTEGELLSFTGASTSLALNSNIHSEQPDNVIQAILYGVQAKSLDLPTLGVMPGFKDTMNDQQITGLVNYLRQRFAPDKPAWSNVAEKVVEYRNNPGSH